MIMKKEKSSHSYFSMPAWRYYYQFQKAYRFRLIASSLGFILLSYLILPTLWLVKHVFDVAIPQKQVNTFIWVGLAILAIRLVNSGFGLFLRNSNIRIISSTVLRLRESLMNKIFSFSRAFYTREDLGVLHARIVQDTERVSNMSNTLIAGLLPAIFLSVGLCVVLFMLSWYLFLMILIFFPLIYLSNRNMGSILKQKVRDYKLAFEGFSKGTLFLMKFMDLIKIQAAEDEELEKQANILSDLRDKTNKRNFFQAFNSVFQNIIIGLIGILVMIIGGISVVKGRMTLGDLMAFYLAAQQLQEKLNSISNNFTNLVVGNESLITLYEIASQKDEEPYNGNEKIDFRGNVRISSVVFGYNETPVLNGVDLKIEPGKSIAVVGDNGAGKSTIINLIIGFYRPQQGFLTAEGVEYENIDFKHLRRQIGIVSQHPPLVPASIRENIIYGNNKISESEMMEVSRLSLADAFIRKLPQGYETQIGDNGILLSGGERQKVAIARALLRKPGLLILDEPTNHLDQQAVKEIMKNISGLLYCPAVLLISHDISVVANADEVFELQDGKLNLRNQ